MFENLAAVSSMYICGGGGLGLGRNLTFEVDYMISGAIGFALKTAPPPVDILLVTTSCFVSDAGGIVFSVFTTRIRNVISQTFSI